MTIKAIETHYDGFRFRSRLEARWAVFFNKADMEYHYELEGLRVDTAIGRVNYLPDFWLPFPGQWAEVKGFLEPEKIPKVVALASAMGECGQGHDTAFLGDIPRQGSYHWPAQLHFHEGHLWAVPWDPWARGCPMESSRGLLVPPQPDPYTVTLLLSGFQSGQPDWAEEALARARQARFEWGESG
jgi:hypothetical protein